MYLNPCDFIKEDIYKMDGEGYDKIIQGFQGGATGEPKQQSPSTTHSTNCLL